MRVIVADDAFLVRDWVRRVLTEAGLEVVADASDADEVVRETARLDPDVVVVDIKMPPTHTDEGVRAAKTIKDTHPRTGVLVLSQYVEASYVTDLLDGGTAGIGYLLKESIADEDAFLDAVRRVAQGGCVVDPGVVALLVARPSASPLDVLTDRERDVLALMAEGRSNQAIGEALFLSPRTVETHIGRIFSKLGLDGDGSDHRRVLAVLTYLRSSG